MAEEEGWVQYVDPASGHPYLYHAQSGESRWTATKPPDAPPPHDDAAPPDDAAAAEASSSSSSSSSDGERGISDDDFEDPDLEDKFLRMLATPEGREAVDAEAARAERLADRRGRERERYEAWRRRRRKKEGGGGLAFLWTLLLPVRVPLRVVRWGWARWRGAGVREPVEEGGLV